MLQRSYKSETVATWYWLIRSNIRSMTSSASTRVDRMISSKSKFARPRLLISRRSRSLGSSRPTREDILWYATVPNSPGRLPVRRLVDLASPKSMNSRPCWTASARVSLIAGTRMDSVMYSPILRRSEPPKYSRKRRPSGFLRLSTFPWTTDSTFLGSCRSGLPRDFSLLLGNSSTDSPKEKLRTLVGALNLSCYSGELRRCRGFFAHCEQILDRLDKRL